LDLFKRLPLRCLLYILIIQVCNPIMKNNIFEMHYKSSYRKKLKPIRSYFRELRDNHQQDKTLESAKTQDASIDSFVDQMPDASTDAFVDSMPDASTDAFVDQTPDTSADSVLDQNPRACSAMLIEHGLHDFLRLKYANGDGDNGNRTASTSIVRMGKMLSWTWLQHGGVEYFKNVFYWLKALAKKYYYLIDTYIKYLKETMLMLPTTLRIYLFDFRSLLQWFSIHRPNLRPKCNSTKLSFCFELVTSLLQKLGVAKKHHYSKVTVLSLIQERKLPAGGLEELQQRAVEGTEWVRQSQDLVILANDNFLHDRFMEVIFVCIYCFSPQGRISGVADMKFSQAMELQQEGFALSSKFKTHATYGYQPVIIAASMQWMLELYLRARQAIVRRSLSLDDALFLDWNGNAEIRIGRLVSSFFKRTCGLRITTTMIRSVVEMATEDARQRGAITVQQQEATHRINGHSSKVVQDFYLRRNMEQSVRLGTAAFESLQEITPSDPVVSTPMRTPSIIPRIVTPMQTIKWGTAHPNYQEHPTARRAEWTSAEVDYIRSWYQQETVRVPGNDNMLSSRCLKAIIKDPAAWPIFHELHTLDSKRMRTGIDKCIASLV